MWSGAAGPLWAIHIPDGFLTWPWLLSGLLGAAALAAGALLTDRLLLLSKGREFGETDVAQVAVLTAAFFVASSIHVPLGPTTVHLLLNGLLGVVLRWRAALAIPVGLLLQAVLIGHGGYTTLGVNSCVLTLPALLAWLLFAGLHRFPWLRASWFRGLLVAVCTLLWGLSLIFSVALFYGNRGGEAVRLDLSWASGVTFHPITLAGVLALAVAAAWLEPRLENAPEFPLGLLVGEVAVLATMALNCAVLIWGGEEDWTRVALLTFVAHMPIAVIEGVVLGFTVGFLARVKPEMLGWSAAKPQGERGEGALSPLAPVLGGEGSGVRGRHAAKPPHPRPLSPAYGGEGGKPPPHPRPLSPDYGGEGGKPPPHPRPLSPDYGGEGGKDDITPAPEIPRPAAPPTVPDPR